MSKKNSETIKSRKSYKIGENESVAIFPHRYDYWEAYGVTGKYCVEKNIYDADKKCNITKYVGSDLSLKDARNIVMKLIEEWNKKANEER